MGYTSVQELVGQFTSKMLDDLCLYLEIFPPTSNNPQETVDAQKAKIGQYLWQLDSGNKGNWSKVPVYESFRNWFFSKVLPSCIYKSREQRIQAAVDICVIQGPKDYKKFTKKRNVEGFDEGRKDQLETCAQQERINERRRYEDAFKQEVERQFPNTSPCAIASIELCKLDIPYLKAVYEYGGDTCVPSIKEKLNTIGFNIQLLVE